MLGQTRRRWKRRLRTSIVKCRVSNSRATRSCTIYLPDCPFQKRSARGLSQSLRLSRVLCCHDQAQTSGLSWCSSAPLNRWIYPRTAQWSKLECKNFTSHPPHPSSLWLPASTCWGESRSSHCFWTGTRHLLSPTSTVSFNGPNFLMVAQIRPTQQAGRGAMCTR